jgi:hypothetical protein
LSKVALELVVETIAPVNSGTTCTPYTIEEVAAVLDTGVVEKGTYASMSEDTTEAFE